MRKNVRWPEDKMQFCKMTMIGLWEWIAKLRAMLTTMSAKKMKIVVRCQEQRNEQVMIQIKNVKIQMKMNLTTQIQCDECQQQ